MTTQASIARDSDRALRPKTFAEYGGQEDVVGNLRVCVRSSLQRGEPLDHVLLGGPPGLGKTTLAEVIANEMGARLVSVHAPSLKTKGELASILTSLRRGDVLFIDEIHALSTKIAEILYPAMEDYKLELVAGNQALSIALEPFTLIGATTGAGKMPRPLRDRFGINCEMQPYSEEKLCDIISSSARKLGFEIDRSGAAELARRSRGTPRIANRMLRRVRDFASGIADRGTVVETCDRLGVDSIGLDRTSRKYLEILAQRGTPLALSTMTSLLGEQQDVVEDLVEPYLMAVGFVEKTRTGRMATAAGVAHIRG